MENAVTLARNTNQALGLGQFAVDFLAGKLGAGPSPAVLERTRLFHTDSVLCGASAIALGTNAPRILREEAMDYPDFYGATPFGSAVRVKTEKAIAANCAAVREWDSNGTNFGYRPELGHTAGEFGHNDYYPVVIAACQMRGLDGATALRAMVLLDEIRGRLAEVFNLRAHKIDHVVHGAIASAVVHAALLGATPEQIESAIGLFVAHYIPWRAIRAGKQLSDSKGASAALSSEVAAVCAKRAMMGFVGPRDIFRNPEAIFRFFEPTTQGAERWIEEADSPFDLVLSHSGDDFAVMGMHFKLGLYEHQSAGAIQGVIDLLARHPELLADPDGGAIERITVVAYEPAYGIIGNPAKKNPTTRQSADHSMAYIVATLVRKALEHVARHGSLPTGGAAHEETWKALMLDPYDYEVSEKALYHPLTRALMDKIDFVHGGPEYDRRYPEGIPTSVRIQARGATYEGELVMFPAGHARNTTADLRALLDHKFTRLAELALPDGHDARALIDQLESIESMNAEELAEIYDFPIAVRSGYRG